MRRMLVKLPRYDETNVILKSKTANKLVDKSNAANFLFIIYLNRPFFIVLNFPTKQFLNKKKPHHIQNASKVVHEKFASFVSFVLSFFRFCLFFLLLLLVFFSLNNHNNRQYHDICTTFGQFSVEKLWILCLQIICQMSVEICCMINIEGFKMVLLYMRCDDIAKYKLGSQASRIMWNA